MERDFETVMIEQCAPVLAGSRRYRFNAFFASPFKAPQSLRDSSPRAMRSGGASTPAHFALEPGSVPSCQGPHPRGGWHGDSRDWGSLAR